MISARAGAETTGSHALKKAGEAYQSGNYELAESQIKDISISELDPEQISELYHLQARLAFAFEKNQSMEKALAKLFHYDPEYKLDQFRDPPTMHEYWRKLKASQTKTASPSSGGREESGENKNSTETNRFFEIENQLKEQSRFWVTLLPFGIGHFDSDRYLGGFSFLGGELLTVYSIILYKKSYSDVRREKVNRVELGTFLGSVFFASLWGYEMNELLPVMNRRDPTKASIVRYGLSFVPFGVGQAKNNHISKAFAFLIGQSLCLVITASSENETLRHLAQAVFFGSWGYGIYDSWANHSWSPIGIGETRQSPWQFRLDPVILGQGTNSMTLGLSTSVLYRF